MFRGGQPNPYDEIVAKTTDENLTSENWELILNLCDKVQEEGETGARNVVAAILKRLTHRTSNVQLYTLTLAESLTKNCGIEVHREIASRAFTQGLEKLIMDRNTHEKVKQRALGLIAEWTHDFEKDPTLGIMEECFENMKAKGFKYQTPTEPPPPDREDILRRQEEEELQRVLEMSVRDKGGRAAWGEYSLATSSGAGGSSSAAAPATTAAASSSSRPAQASQPVYGGYVPAASPAVSAEATSAAPSSPQRSYSVNTSASPAPSVRSTDSIPVVTRVRALHTFEPTEPGELSFEKGEIIKVVDRGYKDWWRGQLKGRTGIFPVNYVEPLPEPTAAELAREAEQEASVFNQAANVDRLLLMLRQMDPAKDNLADNEEIQELYRSCMTLRPKIVKLIDKYSQKRADLVSMNETFVKARSIFDRMMEDSLSRYGQAQGPPDYRQPQPYWAPTGYEQPAYAPYSAAPPGGYAQGLPVDSYGPPQGYAIPPTPPDTYGAPQGFVDHNVYQQPPPGNYPPQPYGQPAAPTSAPYGAPTPAPVPSQAPQGYANGPGNIQSPAPVQQLGSPQSNPQPHVQPQVQPQMQPHLQQPQVQPQVQPVQSQAPIQPQPAQVQQQPVVQQQLAAQPETQPQPQTQPQTQQQQQQQQQPQPEPQQQQQHQQQQPQQPGGPPYVFDPNMTYPDPNVQAWAQYYAQGGTDPTGALYFISVPGVKEATPSPPIDAPSSPTGQAAQPAAQAQGYQLYDGPAGQGSVPNTQPLNVQRTAQPTYGASLSTSPSRENSAEGQGWPGQYANLPNQFAGLSVGGQPGQPGPAGVGASA